MADAAEEAVVIPCRGETAQPVRTLSFRKTEEEKAQEQT
jgi:hypothetical protein